MKAIDGEESRVTVYQLYKQLVKTLDLPVRKIPTTDSGDFAGRMYRGFYDSSLEEQQRALRRAFRGPYVEPEIRTWMYRNDISPHEVCPLVRGRGVFIEDDRNQCPLIDFDYWADVNEDLRRQGAILPCDVETGIYRPGVIATPYRPHLDDSFEDANESTRGAVGLVATCAEFLRTAWATFGSYFFAGRPTRL